MKKSTTRILKILGGVAAGAVTLVVIVLVATAVILNSASIQTKLIHYATEMLTERLDTHVGIDSIHVNVWRNSIEIYGLDIEDQQNRKMLNARELNARVSLLSLLNNDVRVEKAQLSDVRAALYKEPGQPANFQFIIDSLKSNKPKPESKVEDKEKKQNKKKLKLELHDVTLEKIQVVYNESSYSLGQLQLNLSSKGEVNARLSDVRGHWVQQKKRGPVINEVRLENLVIEGTKEKGHADISGLNFQTNNGKPRKNKDKPKRGFFDVGHLNVTAKMHLDYELPAPDSLIADITGFQARDSVTGIDIRDLHTHINANKQVAHLTDLSIQHRQTVLHVASADLVLPNKKEGRKFSYSTGAIKGKTLLKDISRTFAPVLSKFSIPLNLSLTMSGTDSTIAFRNIHVNTDDKKLTIAANGDIKNLKDSKKLDIRFRVSNMTAKGGIKEKIISQFPVKRLMMKQLHALGTITYKGVFTVLWKHEQFQGTLGTAGGPLNFTFAIDDLNKYVSGNVKTKAFNLGKVMDMDNIGTVDANADFKIDISKQRTAQMRKKKGGKLPIGTVNAIVEDCSYKGIHVRNLTADIKSDGAECTGDILQHGKRRDLYCSFLFTNTDEMHKIKIKNPGIKFHKYSDEDKKATQERRELKKQQKAAAKAEKQKQKAAAKEQKEQDGKKKKKFLGLF